ncbi:EEF1AKNMT [Symbiodinium sp. CCMP2592]|nr:EEF1AKNMT [Symbiodinium sp. CCMP2592]
MRPGQQILCNRCENCAKAMNRCCACGKAFNGKPNNVSLPLNHGGGDDGGEPFDFEADERNWEERMAAALEVARKYSGYSKFADSYPPLFAELWDKYDPDHLGEISAQQAKCFAEDMVAAGWKDWEPTARDERLWQQITDVAAYRKANDDIAAHNKKAMAYNAELEAIDTQSDGDQVAGGVPRRVARAGVFVGPEWCDQFRHNAHGEPSTDHDTLCRLDVVRRAVGLRGRTRLVCDLGAGHVDWTTFVDFTNVAAAGITVDLEGVGSEAPPYADPKLGAVYWDARHARAGAAFFDWYVPYARLHPVFALMLPGPDMSPEILDVGFGTSEVPLRLFENGWELVTAIDTSAEAVRLAKGRGLHQERPALQFLQMDARVLNFPDECFDVVFDKATLDTILCAANNNQQAQAYVSEAYRVLKPGGLFLVVSHSGPSCRLHHLVQDPLRSWQIQVARLPGKPPSPVVEVEEGMEEAPPEDASRCFWIFACTKPGGHAEEDAGASEPVAEPQQALAEASEAAPPLTTEHRRGFL